MVVKVYISGISGNKEVKKRQQRVLLILDSKNIKYELLDIAEPNMEEAKEYMQNNSKQLGATIGDPNPRHSLPPQLFNDDDYCGDYDAFDMANEIDEMEQFLKLAPEDSASTLTPNVEVKLGNGEVSSEETPKEPSPEKVEFAEVQKNGIEEESVPKPEVKSDEESLEQKEEITEKNEEEASEQKEEEPSDAKEESAGDQNIENETDDQKEENKTDDQKVENGSKEENDVAKETEETEKSEEA